MNCDCKTIALFLRFIYLFWKHTLTIPAESQCSHIWKWKFTFAVECDDHSPENDGLKSKRGRKWRFFCWAFACKWVSRSIIDFFFCEYHCKGVFRSITKSLNSYEESVDTKVNGFLPTIIFSYTPGKSGILTTCFRNSNSSHLTNHCWWKVMVL